MNSHLVRMNSTVSKLLSLFFADAILMSDFLMHGNHSPSRCICRWPTYVATPNALEMLTWRKPCSFCILGRDKAFLNHHTRSRFTLTLTWFISAKKKSVAWNVMPIPAEIIHHDSCHFYGITNTHLNTQIITFFSWEIKTHGR